MAERSKGAELVGAYDAAMRAANQAACGGSNDEFNAAASDAVASRNAIIARLDQRDELLAALKNVREYIDQPGQTVRDLYPVFGLDSRRVKEAVAAAIARAESTP